LTLYYGILTGENLLIYLTNNNMKQYNLIYKDNNLFINDIKINDEIFEKELSDYKIEEKESMIDNLIDWISEATTDKEMMKDDLKYIMETEERDDDLFFSSISTNKYVFKSDNEGTFNDICQEILKLN